MSINEQTEPYVLMWLSHRLKQKDDLWFMTFPSLHFRT